MRYRLLGNLIVSEIGFGAWGIGGATEGATSYGPTDDSVSRSAIRTALANGINFFDTSNVYGDGHSEELLGQELNHRRGQVIIATKAGLQKHNSEHDLSSGSLRRSLEGSLKRLGTDYVDLLQLHSPPMILLLFEQFEVMGILDQFQKEGLIREFGISVKSPQDGIRAVQLGFRVLQVNFSMIDQRAWECGLIDLAEKTKASLIARTPFCFGFLTGKLNDLNFDARDHRSGWSRAQLEKWLEASKMFDKLNAGKSRRLHELALKFCIYPKVFSTVIPGIQTPAEAIENASVSELPDLTPEEIEIIQNIYKQNDFYIAA